MKRPSFLERLTGSVNLDEYDDGLLDEDVAFADENDTDEAAEEGEGAYDEHDDRNAQEGELPVDMYQTGDSIVIRALVAGVSPEDLDNAITRDMVTIKGHRQEDQEAPDEDYYHRELFWGTFSRTLLLPEEVLIDEAEAKEQHGLLQIILPKVDKDRSTKLKVKTNSTK